MSLKYLIVLGAALPQFVSARAVYQRAVSCQFSTASSGESCQAFASGWGLSLSDFQKLNPGTDCSSNLVSGNNYCVIGTVTADPTSSSSTTTAQATSTSTQSSSSSSSSSTVIVTTTSTSTTKLSQSTTASTTSSLPTQSGLVANCNKFHAVVSGDTCVGIESAADITAAQFLEWNPSIDTHCTNLWAGYNVCIGVSGTTATATTATPTATTTNSPSVPSPTMPGTVSSCKEYYKVASGDSCVVIDSKYNIDFSTFREWNTQIDENCSNLWLGYYVCVSA